MAVEILTSTNNRSVKSAIFNGVKCRCPNCGEGKLFTKWLKVTPVCTECGEELHHEQAQDFPPYITLMIVGHVVVTLLMLVEAQWDLSLNTHLMIWMPLALILSLAMMQPVKGGVVGLQWALRMFGFGKSRKRRKDSVMGTKGHTKVTGGMSRDEVERAAVFDGSKRSPNMEPKDAATLIILDGEGPGAKVLMGRRHEGHKFMPGLFVFPGGRVDRFDGSVPAANELDPVVEAKILKNLRRKPSKRRTRALGLAAIRETYEEAGLLLGEKGGGFSAKHEDWQAFSQLGVTPTLAPLRLIARAITPPGRTRRFDAWFFATKAEHIAHRLPEGTGPSGELQDLHWLTFDEAKELELPAITVTVLDELSKRLTVDPSLNVTEDVPFYHLKGKSFLRDMI